MPLRAVEVVVGALEERHRVVLGLQLGDAGRDLQPARLRNRTRGDVRLQPPVELLGVVERRLGEDDRELVAAHPAGDVRGADDVADAVGHLGENGIAREVADLVVDRLEVV